MNYEGLLLLCFKHIHFFTSCSLILCIFCFILLIMLHSHLTVKLCVCYLRVYLFSAQVCVITFRLYKGQIVC